MSIVLSGVQQEHYIHQAMRTHCRKGAVTEVSSPSGYPLGPLPPCLSYLGAV